MWTGLLTKGQIVSSGYYSQGVISATAGSTIITGTNTKWTAILGGQPIIGQQLRTGFTSPIYTIVGADLLSTPQTLTLELPWGNQSVASTGYFVSKYYFSIPNIRYFYYVLNTTLMYRMLANIPQTLLANWDPSRLQMSFPRVVASMPPDSAGNYQFELWPCANYVQAFPYMAYIQPPNLVNDDDNFPPFMRTDLIQAKTLAEALLYKPKMNPAYSEATCITVSQQKLKEYETEILHAADADEAKFRQDVLSQFEMFPLVSIDPLSGGMLSGGAYSAAMSPVMADGWDY
jgi:hypothetical protein